MAGSETGSGADRRDGVSLLALAREQKDAVLLKADMQVVTQKKRVGALGKAYGKKSF